MELAEANRILMFSSDYPHYDFDHPARALPKGLSKETRRRVMCENARELYDLPATRPAAPCEVTR
jgi:predicted TIM-barrel fold metal-dependent hydrolase